MNTQPPNNLVNPQPSPITPPPAPPVEEQPTPEDLQYQAQTAAEQKNIEQIADQLMHQTYDALLQTYGAKDIFEKTVGQMPVTSSNVVAYISMLKHLFILDFIPPENVFNISAKKKDDIITVISSAQLNETPQAIDQKLKQIDPTFKIPESFNLANSQLPARELANANFNLKNIIVVNLISDYMTDTMHFSRMSANQLKSLLDELSILSDKIQIEYDKAIKNQPINEAIFDDISNFLSECGRSVLFLNEIKERKNLGDSSEIILKITTALQIAYQLRQKFPQNVPTQEQIMAEIKEYLMKDISI